MAGRASARNIGDIPGDIPRGAKRSLEKLHARVVGIEHPKPQRTYLRLEADGMALVLKYSSHAHHSAVLRHETAVREIVGTDLPLRAPKTLASGAGWLIEPWITQRPRAGSPAVDALVGASLALAKLDLPHKPPRRDHRTARMNLWKRFTRSRMGSTESELMKEWAAAKTLLQELVSSSDLPRVTSHGDFHPHNVLFDEEGPWVIDWEQTGIRVAGYDLMRYWPTLQSESDRAHLFERTVEAIGPRYRDELSKLRYAFLMRAIATKYLRVREREAPGNKGEKLLELLPDVRAAAGISAGR